MVKDGDVFGRLTVLHKTEEKLRKRFLWKCRCVCGTELLVVQDALRKIGGTQSCGCLLRDKITEHGRGLVDISGQRYERLLVVKNSGLRKYNRVLWECLCDCGKVCFLLKTSLVGKLVKSCGCWKADLARQRCKEKHPAWKGGMEKQCRDRNCQALKIWRKKVYYRDNYTCQVCDKRGGRLNAHHLESFADYPELRFIVENGATLCVGCHRLFHKKYGKEHVRKWQFLEFQNEK